MKICDSHNDFLTSDYIEKEKMFKRLNKVGKICCAVFTTNKGFSVKDIEIFKNEVRNYKNIIFTIEDVGCFDLKDIEEIIKLNPFACTLTWNYNNDYAGGSNGKIDLTEKGKYLVKILEENKILIDTAHLNRKSFYRLVKITKFPIFNSHANIYNIHKHKRNLTDKQIDTIVKSNGYLGISLYQDFVSNKIISSKDIALQFDYLIKKFGYKNFGFGTDFFGIETNKLPTDINSYKDINNVFIELKKLGYSKKIIRHIAYKNFIMFINRLKREKLKNKKH